MNIIYIDRNRAITAFFLANLVFAFSYVSLPYVFEIDATDIDGWGFTSSKSVSGSMENHIDELVYHSVNVGIISSTIKPDNSVIFGKSDLPIFNNNVQAIMLYKDLVHENGPTMVNFTDEMLQTDAWILNREICCLDFEMTEFTPTEDTFDPLFESLSDDFKSIENYFDITENYLQVLDGFYRLEGQMYWLVNNVYEDGRFVEIQVFQDNIVIRITYIEYLVFKQQSVELKIDTAIEPVVYSGIIDAVPLSNYKLAVDNVIDSIFDGM